MAKNEELAAMAAEVAPAPEPETMGQGAPPQVDDGEIDARAIEDLATMVVGLAVPNCVSCIRPPPSLRKSMSSW